MKSEIVKMLCRYMVWFGMSFLLLWLAGVGSLFEHMNPFRALITFSIVLVIFLEAVYQWELRKEKEINELKKRIEQLEQKEYL